MTGRFRKRPIVVEAHQFAFLDADRHHRPEFQGPPPAWLKQALADRKVRGFAGGLAIDTLEGTMRASPGDWIIRGVQGELYPCRADIFAATYEPVEEGSG